MYVPRYKENLLRKVIKDLYNRKFDDSLILDTANATAELVGGHYFAFCLFNQVQSDRPVFISNNPESFIPVYLSVLNQDFLIKALLEGGQEYVLRRRLEFYQVENAEFVKAVQTARPISDIIYDPLLAGGQIRGYCALGRAGLHNSWYSDSEIELFRFIAAFVNDAFRRAFIPEPNSEDVAYLDREGNFIASGARIGELCSRLFGWQASILSEDARRNRDLFLRSYRHFLSEGYRVGKDRLVLETGGRRFFFLFENAKSMGMLESCRGPCATIRVLDKVYNEYIKTLLDFPYLSRRYGITRREYEVIQGIFQAKSNKVIAFELHVDESTIKRHTHNIYEKTGFRTRVELVQYLGSDSR